MAAASVAAASRGTVAAIACASDSGTKARLSAGNRGRGAPGGSLERRKADELSGRGRAGEAGGSSACCHSGIGATLAVADARRAQQLAPTPPPLPSAAAIARVREGTNTAAELANSRQWRMPAVSVSVRRAPGNVAASSLPFLSDSSARSISSAILRRGGSPAPLNDGLNHTLWAITRLAGSSFPSSSPLSSTPSPSKFLVHSVAEKPPAAILEDDDSAVTNRIWLSDVVAKKERAYFQRPWTGKDLTYLSHILLLHVASLAAPFTFSWDAFAVFFSLYVVTGLFGITLSFHRNLSHKAFKLPKWLEYTFAYCGVQAMQGDPLEWVSSHRYHHLYCDTPLDPHSPKEGFWHSHICWLLDASRIEGRLGKRTNIADMENDPFYQFIRKTYPLHLVGLSLLLFAWGGLPYLIWGVALRTVFVYHITWLVNSASHVWGSQKWNTGDLSRNNWWVALLAFGEGWHNNHHAFEYSARHGLDWWQLDLTWYVIKALEKMGLATNVKLPRPDQMSRLSFPPSQ